MRALTGCMLGTSLKCLSWRESKKGTQLKQGPTLGVRIEMYAGFANTSNVVILRQNCSDDSTEVMEGVTLTPEIFGNKQGATSTPEIFSYKHSFVLTFFATNTISVNCKRCKP